MKRILLIALLVVMLALTSVGGVLAQGNGPAPGEECGRFFAAHVVEHAQSGHFGAEHNPGMHQGLANFLDHHEEEHTCQ